MGSTWPSSILIVAMQLVVSTALVGCGGEGASEPDRVDESTGSQAVAQSELPPGHPAVSAPQGDTGIASPPPGSGTGVAGLTWEAPVDWVAEPPRNAMRKAQYRVPGSGGDGECVVFYFGPGQGGDPQSNAKRWAGQFTRPNGGSALEAMRTEQIEIEGIQVLLVEVSGTYSGGMMGGPSLELVDHRLLGAVAQGADANWFFKFTGPASTVGEQQEAFMTMIRSLRRGGEMV